MIPKAVVLGKKSETIFLKKQKDSGTSHELKLKKNRDN